MKGFLCGQLSLAFMDQSYFKNAPNVPRILYKPEMKNIFYKLAEHFGISVTGIMGVNCESLIEFYDRNNAFTTIRTLSQFRYLNMENETGKEILNNDPILYRENIKDDLMKQIPSESERLQLIDIERSKNRKNDSTTLNKITQICNKKKNVTSTQISVQQRKLIVDLLTESNVSEILEKELPIILVLDNAKIHKATDVEIACEILNMELVFLPTYSPELNPIEDLWRIIKSVVYSTDYNSLDELVEIITTEFYENVTSESLYENWVNEYMS